MKTLLETEIRDWRFGEGQEVPLEEDKKTFKLTVKFEEGTGQLYVDVEGGDETGLQLFVEINEGRPCIHVGNSIYGDHVLHAFGMDNGVIVIPDGSKNPVSAPKSRHTYDTHQGLLFES